MARGDRLLARDLLFFLLGPWSECLRIFLTCLRDDRLTIFVESRVGSGQQPARLRLRHRHVRAKQQACAILKERPQFIWIGKRYRTDIFWSFTVGNPTNDQPPILRIRSRNNCRAMATDLDFVSFCQLSYHESERPKKKKSR
jgi:hypothetical protein